ncbi:methyl-accepting chemotaxis protein [Pleionea sp. CnH1-48]|uniref:methyl-accepting chemotaxis protein n=1 Tax=Pleionea sp. CnH1-48 TaxID=2954494 RepID=UPI0020976B49|nr:methyl-accepting chemotaxis protein [Pleionea sp. CnH1-48]MCO7224466.1 methyl-accepting chemotaxis protein [Pleionea sp. CnH1-48]
MRIMSLLWCVVGFSILLDGIGILIGSASLSFVLIKNLIFLVVLFIGGHLWLYAPLTHLFNKSRMSEDYKVDLALRLEPEHSGPFFGKLFEQQNEQWNEADKLMQSVLGSISRFVPISEGVRDNQIEFEQMALINGIRNEEIFTGLKKILASNHVVQADVGEAFRSIGEEKELVTSAREVIEQAVDSINLLVENVREAGAQIASLKEASEEIDGIIQVINAIAEQTNLLALNAAIEAARAGESGRGFAVVADEVRQLATRTHESTLEVRDNIERIQTLTQSAYDCMNRGESISEEAVQHTKSSHSHLAEIFEALNRVNSTAEHIKSSAEKEYMETEQVIASIEGLERLNSVLQDKAKESTLTADDMINLFRVISDKMQSIGLSKREQDTSMRTKRRVTESTESKSSGVELFVSS